MSIFKKQYDLIAIGDTVTDAFIKLKEAHITCKLDNSECEICMKYGDKIPFESVEVCPAVGNSANAAVSGARLGVKSAIVTFLGKDQNGNEAIDTFKQNGVGTDYIKQESNKKTNYHYVLWYEVDRTILIKHEEYKYYLPEFREPKWIYLSSLAEHSLSYHQEIATYLNRHPSVKLVFQPGTFQMKFGIEALKDIYTRTEIFFCNKEEAQRILNTDISDIKELSKKLQTYGPKIVVITDGPNGAYAFNDEKLYFIPPYPDPKKPIDRTGAGDAFASTFAIAIMKGKTIEEALLWAPINSMSVVQQVGAQKGLLTESELISWLEKAPQDYRVKLI